MNFKQLNNVGGWLVFLIALITYSMTVESTASLWDCGEFIACAYKLQVPHPPGAPFFLLLGRFFSLFAGSDTQKVALMVNYLSVISGASTILFMFWTITLIGRKLVKQNAESISASNTIKILGAALVGSLIYTFSDSFWFSAVETEVYSTSSFFMAIVTWAAFKWELIEDESTQNRWLLFIAYLIGLSIGIHLLNLVTLPALAILYYYKKSKKDTLKGVLTAFGIGLLLVGLIMSGLITGLPSIIFGVEKIFVNTIGLPFGSGMAFTLLILIGTLVYGIIYTDKKGKVIWNTALLAFGFILMGYSTYAIALIRSNYNPPINENNPSDVLNFTYYLKREQYGSRSISYGPIYTAKVTDVKRGEPHYIKGKDKYEISDYSPEYSYSADGQMLLPRVWSGDPAHARVYQNILGLTDGQRPSFFDNLKFMFQHQFGKMFWRYFIWNFWGRSSDMEGAGGTDIFESQSDIPQLFANDKARTNYFGLPLILGVLGFLYMYSKDVKRTIVNFLLFFFTGLALVIYLNGPPIEPRERDYIYVGAFYFFAMWAGIGVMFIAEYIQKLLKNPRAASITATVLGLVVPIVMVRSAYAGHDRSNRYHQVDFAKNMLSSCEKNAILFVGGDNDTFPLWYVQEVEGFRTDVRVCNLSLLGTDWYIDQMKRKTYESDPLPISLDRKSYLKGANDQIPYYENNNPEIKAGINLTDYLTLVKTNNPAIQMPISTGDNINILPSANFILDVDVDKVASMAFIPQQDKARIQSQMKWTFGKKDIIKNDLVVLDIVAHNQWKRPVYFAGTLAQDSYVGLKDHMQLEGYAYRLMPFQGSTNDQGFVNVDILQNKMMNKMVWRNLDNKNIFYPNTYNVALISGRYAFLRLAEQLLRDGKNDQSEKVMDHCIKVMPDTSVPYDQIIANFSIFYYSIGNKEKARKVSEVMANRIDKELDYFIEKNNKPGNREWGDANIQEIIQRNMRTIQQLYSSAENRDPEFAERYRKIYEKHLAKLK